MASFFDQLFGRARANIKTDGELALATRMGQESRALAALDSGADPTRVVQLAPYSPGTNAILEAIDIAHPQPAILDAILARGFRPNAHEMQKVMRAITQQPDFDGHPGPTLTYDPLVRVLFKHGLRFNASAQDPRMPEDTQADYIQRHAPALRDLDWASPSHSGLRVDPPSKTLGNRNQLGQVLQFQAENSRGRNLDEIRHMIDQGAPTAGLIGRAIGALNPELLKLALDSGEKPTPDDLRALVRLLPHETFEPDKMVRVLFQHGERFNDMLEPKSHPGLTLADCIRDREPRLAADLNWNSAPKVSSPDDQSTTLRRHSRPS